MMDDKLNSNIYKNPEEQHIIDLSNIGTIEVINNQEIVQEDHYFHVGDVIYYDIQLKRFSLALAYNNIESEVVGLVSQIIDNDTFVLTNTGTLYTDRYTFPKNTVLYLSDINPGKLVSIAPTFVKPVAIQTTNGIIIDIARGWADENSVSESTEYEAYTQEELDEIISNIW